MKTIVRLALFSAAICCTPFAHADIFGSGANAFDIEFVDIGNPSNAADTTGTPNPAGSVDYAFRMGKYAISRDMVTKANALGGLNITLDPMSAVSGGTRPDMPATGIRWFEAARFVNWLNTSQGFQPAYKFSIAPGEPGYISHQGFQLWEAGDSGFDPDNQFRNSLAKYVLPSVHEWYKAAYYDPNANGGAGGYWNYPTGSNSVPTSVISGTAPGTMVYGIATSQGPADITQAGGLSPYGTMGQGGNAAEWEETTLDLANASNSGLTSRAFRGSWWDHFFIFASSTQRGGTGPHTEGPTRGFRVASVTPIPEPSTLLLAMLASAGLLPRRGRRS